MAQKRVALVTGSGKRRLGWHITGALVDRGYCVVIHYNTSSIEAIKNVKHWQVRGAEAIAVQADLTDEAQVQELIRESLVRFERLDVLVNSAAIWESKGLEEITAKDVRRHFEVNLLGTFLCSQKAGLAMARQPEGGVIINFGDWALARPYQNYAAYFASKGAIPALTRCLAVELAARNPRVRVNCILPGPVMLPPEMSELERGKVVESTLAKREGRPENVAQAVLALIDNDFITGACLPVDGGRTIFAAGDP